MAGIPQTLQTPPPVSVQTMLYNTYLQIIGGGTSFVGALDNYVDDMLEAWSWRRKLLSSYSGGAFEVRRESDDATDEVVYGSDGELALSQLTGFVGASTGRTSALRGQLNGYDLLQTTNNFQRIVVDSGSVVTVGGKPAARGITNTSDSVDLGGGMQTDTFATYTGTTLSMFIRGQQTDYTGSIYNSYADVFCSMTKDNGAITASGSFGLFRNAGDPSSNVTSVQPGFLPIVSGTTETDYLISVIFDGSNVTLRDGTNTYSAAYSTSFDVNRCLLALSAIGGQVNASAINRIQELAIWTSDQTANESAIRSAILA